MPIEEVLEMEGQYQGLIRQRGLCTLCRVFEDRKLIRRRIRGISVVKKLFFGNLEYPGAIIDRILDFTSGSKSKRARKEMLTRRNLHETLSRPGMFRELTKYWDRTCRQGEIWTRSDLLDRIISFVADGYSEKWEGYKHMFEGPQKHQYTPHIFAMLWYLNGQPIDMNYIKATWGHLEHVLPPVNEIDWKSGKNNDNIIDYPAGVLPMPRPSGRFLSKEDEFEPRARMTAGFLDTEHTPTGPPHSSGLLHPAVASGPMGPRCAVRPRAIGSTGSSSAETNSMPSVPMRIALPRRSAGAAGIGCGCGARGTRSMRMCRLRRSTAS